MSPDQNDLSHVIDLFKSLNLPVTDDGNLVETKGRELEGFYLKKKGSPDPQQRAEADTWFKNRTKMLQDWPAVLDIVRTAFVSLADATLGAALAAGIKQLTPELASQLERLALDQCKCDPPLAHSLVTEYLTKNGLTVNAPLTKPRRLIAKCPFCLGRHEATKPPYYCSVFNNEEIPEAFIRDYDRVPPLWVSAVSFGGHGKAGYLADLTQALENIQRAWPGTTQQYLDQQSSQAVRALRRPASAGGTPDVTGKGVPRPLLLPLYDVPDAGSRCLVLFDTPGELYETLKGPDDVERIQALMEVKNIWFTISLKALRDNPTRRISDLLTAYIGGTQRLKWPLAGRNLIVVYTDADKVWSELPGRIQGYLRSDPFQNLAAAGQPVADLSNFSLGSYVEKMRAISGELSEHTRQRIPGGDPFIALARRHALELVFTVSSAPGADSDARPGRARQTPARCRVLDPYLWALYLDKSAVRRPIKLVLDAAKGSDPVYALALNDLVEKLADLGEVTTYHLGAATQITAPGQPPPPRKPARPRPRLIGPLLDQAAPNTKVVAIVTGPIRDLEDYFNSNWRERLRLIAVGAHPYQEWPNTILLQPKGDVKAAYEDLAGWIEAMPGR